MEAQAQTDAPFDSMSFGVYLRDWLIEHFSFFDARIGKEMD